MSSLSVSSSALSYSAFQAITGTQPSAASSGSATASTDPLLAASSTSGTTPSPADALLSATQQAAPQAQGGHHHHGHGGGKFKQIEDAVTSALQSAQNDPSADPNSLIENAIAGVVQSGQTGSQQTGGTVSPNGGTTSTITDSSANGNAQDFGQLLQSFGVSQQQFRSDFLSAIQQAQNGQINTSTAFQSIPSGSVVNVLS